MLGSDPLEDIHELADNVKIAVIISVLRTTRESQARIEKKLDWVLRALWGLVASIVIGILIAVITSHSRTIKPTSIHAGGSTPPAVSR